MPNLWFAFLVPGQPGNVVPRAGLEIQQSCTDGLLLNKVLVAGLNSTRASLRSLTTTSSSVTSPIKWHEGITLPSTPGFPVTFFQTENC